MAISRQGLIERTMLTLGITQKYNDNSNRFRTIMEDLLERIIEEMPNNRDFAFNQKTAKLNYYDTTEKVDGEYIYNRPYGMHNLVFPSDIRIEGEFIYSENKDQVIRYNQQLPLEEFPDNIFNYLRFKLSFEMAVTYPEFRDRQQEFYALMSDEMNKITSNESPKTRNVLKEILSIW